MDQVNCQRLDQGPSSIHYIESHSSLTIYFRIVYGIRLSVVSFQIMVSIGDNYYSWSFQLCYRDSNWYSMLRRRLANKTSQYEAGFSRGFHRRFFLMYVHFGLAWGNVRLEHSNKATASQIIRKGAWRWTLKCQSLMLWPLKVKTWRNHK